MGCLKVCPVKSLHRHFRTAWSHEIGPEKTSGRKHTERSAVVKWPQASNGAVCSLASCGALPKGRPLRWPLLSSSRWLMPHGQIGAPVTCVEPLATFAPLCQLRWIFQKNKKHKGPLPAAILRLWPNWSLKTLHPLVILFVCVFVGGWEEG